MTLQPYGAQRLQALRPIGAIPQFGNTALRHVVMAASTKYRNAVTHRCHKPRMQQHHNNRSDIAPMRHHRIREMTDWRRRALRQNGNPDLPEKDNA